MVSRNAVRRSVPPGELPDFTPVPRRIVRHDGWTPERQKSFIGALADTGCVAIACRMVNMSQPSYYHLRRQPGAESFRAAADAAQTLGLQPVKDEAFDRAMNGQLVPVFVAGKLMGFRRKKNDRLLMFILRHYGEDSQGRKTTINYFSTRASAGAAAKPSPLQGRGLGEGESGESGAAAEASTTTVRTVISGPDRSAASTGSDDDAAAILNTFEGVPLDAEARAQIYRTLEACAERRRALEADPENDPERVFVGEGEAGPYLGELESGAEGDWVEYRPEWEHRWEGLGEGGEAEKIDKVLAEMAERRAKLTPEQIAAEQREHEAEVRRMREERMKRLPVLSNVEGPPAQIPPRNGGEERRMSGGHSSTAGRSLGDHPKGGGGGPAPLSPRTGKPLKRYKKRTPKPPFTAPVEDDGAYQARKAEAAAAVDANRRELAAAEAERRNRRKADAGDGSHIPSPACGRGQGEGLS